MGKWQQDPSASTPSSSDSSSSSTPGCIGFEKRNAGETGALMDHADSTQLDAPQLCSEKESKAKWQRDLAIFCLGTVVGVALFICSGPFTSHIAEGPLPPCPPGWGLTSDRLNSSDLAASAASGHRYAFVQIAHDPPDAPLRHIWQVLAMARALQRFSAHPLVLLTNTTQLPDGTPLASTLRKLNVQTLPVHEVHVPEGTRLPLKPSFKFGYWKLQIWRLTQFEKLIWLDTDTILVRSIDWLFERAPAWAQRDNSKCDSDQDSGSAQDWLSGGLMLIAPSEDTFDGLQHFAAESSGNWSERGDEGLIFEYFRQVHKRPVRLLGTGEASFGKCLGSTPGIPYESLGPWNVPAFVHRSSWNNVCFFCDLDAQQSLLDGQIVNICNYHPLGSFWRDLFCSAIQTMRVKTNQTEVFCDDYRWYTK
mmetsp:Transcript_102481/g.330660  ORF Transcript_102481/g.330660 Transcript_102481/m.330660 type:complete len:421 (-) Transcript_102481:344-1606(-)